MIQRIQTLYLLICLVLTVVCVVFEVKAENHPWALTAIMAVTGVLEFMGIFLFRRRALQMRVCTFCIILLLGWYATYVAFAYMVVELLVLLGVVTDPTTKGMGDSQQAMGYDRPKE